MRAGQVCSAFNLRLSTPRYLHSASHDPREPTPVLRVQSCERQACRLQSRSHVAFAVAGRDKRGLEL